MVELAIPIIILCLLVAVGSALIALRIQYRSLDNTRQEREAWQQAQEGRQRTWEVRQGKHILDAEKKLADQLKDARKEWRDWNIQQQQEHQRWREDVDLEKELAKLPHVEHVELLPQSSSGHAQPANWQPAALYRADLRGRDLSYRYLERADLREAQLTEANLYMANLSGASLTSATLEQTNLTGANLSGADLRGANLTGASFLVADLHNVVLHGTNLTGARNLTPEQLQTAIYDSTTIIDSTIDITLPRIPGVQTTPATLLASTTSAPAEKQTSSGIAEIPETPAADMIFVNPSAAALGQFPASTAESGTNANTNAETPETAPALQDETALTSAAENTLPVPSVEVIPETSADSAAENLTTDGTTVPTENDALSTEATKKQSASKKRASKTRQSPATLPPPISIGEQETTDAGKPDEDREMDKSKRENEGSEKENRWPSKIIQLPTRATKTRPLPGASEQGNSEPSQKRRANNRSASFNSSANKREDQHAQAN